jgi:hypothetical protein
VDGAAVGGVVSVVCGVWSVVESGGGLGVTVMVKGMWVVSRSWSEIR